MNTLVHMFDSILYSQYKGHRLLETYFRCVFVSHGAEKVYLRNFATHRFSHRSFHWSSQKDVSWSKISVQLGSSLIRVNDIHPVEINENSGQLEIPKGRHS